MVQEVLLDVLVPGHQLHIVHLHSVEDEAVLLILNLGPGDLPPLGAPLLVVNSRDGPGGNHTNLLWSNCTVSCEIMQTM